MSFFVAVKNCDGNYKHHKVSEEVYYYIKQLETYIKNSEQSSLKIVYPDRFPDERNNKNEWRKTNRIC